MRGLSKLPLIEVIKLRRLSQKYITSIGSFLLSYIELVGTTLIASALDRFPRCLFRLVAAFHTRDRNTMAAVARRPKWTPGSSLSICLSLACT